MSRCAECGTRSTRRTYFSETRLAGGDYRRAVLTRRSTVCDECVRAAAAYARDTGYTVESAMSARWGTCRWNLGRLILIHDLKLDGAE